MQDQHVLRCLVGQLAQPSLQQKGELGLEQFLFHKNLAPCFQANLHNADTRKGKDVRHCGVTQGFVTCVSFMHGWGSEKQQCTALCRLERVYSQVDLHTKPNGTALSRGVLCWKAFHVSCSNVGKAIFHKVSMRTVGRQGQRTPPLCSLTR